MKGDVDRLAAVEDDTREILVKEGLDADDFVTLVEEGEQRGEHAWREADQPVALYMRVCVSLTLIGTGSHNDLLVGQLAAFPHEIFKLRRVLLRNGLEQARTSSRVAVTGCKGLAAANGVYRPCARYSRVVVGHHILVHGLV